MGRRLWPVRLTVVCCVMLSLLGVTRGEQPVSAPSDRAPQIARNAAPRLTLSPASHTNAWPVSATVQLPPVDTPTLLAEDATAKAAGGVPLRVGVNRLLPNAPLTPSHAGTWTKGADGARNWTLEIRATDARGLRVHFSNFALPDTGRVIVTGADGVAVREIKGMGPDGGGTFWSATIKGDTALIEYVDPSGQGADPIIEIDQISHLYRTGVFDTDATEETALLSCHEDVNCFSVPQTARDAVGRMVFTIPGQGSYLCSGALLDDLDPNTYAGYFLTANHCISSQDVASSLQVLWFYQTDSCHGTVSSGPTSLGSTLLAHSSNSDFSLLRLADDPRDGQGLAAWTTSSPSGTVHGVHHPSGSYKRYSEGPVTTQQPICGGLPLSRYVYNDWTTGVTEGGSSGSPLFNSNWEVVGQLFGACYFSEPGCNNPQDYNNVYGRFSVSYASMSSYLTSITPDDGYEDNDTLASAAAITDGTYGLRLADFDDYFVLSTPGAATVSVTATFNTSDMDLDLYMLADDGTVIGVSNGSSATKSITVSVGAGDHIVRAYKAYGWGGDYSLTIQTLDSDCNGNGVEDSLDISNLTSTDCDGNDLPDECQIDMTGGAPGGPYYCSLGCDPDCNTTGVPDACELVGNDDNGNGVPDECDCAVAPAPLAEQIENAGGTLVTSAKNRYLSFTDGEVGAIRVTFVTLPGAFSAFNGTTAWVQTPDPVSALPGKGLADDPGADPTFMAAGLGPTPVFEDWSVYGVVHIYDERIIPSRKSPTEPLEPAIYQLQAVPMGCDPTIAGNLSAPLTITNPRWGDMTQLASGEFVAPDGTVAVDDTLGLLATFGSAVNAPAKVQVDLVGLGASGPVAAQDGKVSISDLLTVLAAFGGAEYPFDPPAP